MYDDWWSLCSGSRERSDGCIGTHNMYEVKVQRQTGYPTRTQQLKQVASSLSPHVWWWNWWLSVLDVHSFHHCCCSCNRKCCCRSCSWWSRSVWFPNVVRCSSVKSRYSVWKTQTLYYEMHSNRRLIRDVTRFSRHSSPSPSIFFFFASSFYINESIVLLSWYILLPNMVKRKKSNRPNKENNTIDSSGGKKWIQIYPIIIVHEALLAHWQVPGPTTNRILSLVLNQD